MLRSAFRLAAAPVLVALLAAISVPVQAGTTGGITGRVLDNQTQTPIAGVTVTAVSPSQSATSISDSNGSFRFLSLPPDSYVLTLTHDGYDPVSQAGISIFADQVQNLNVSMNKALKTIAKVTSRTPGNLVKAGSTSDVYSIDAAAASASGSLVGPGGLNSAYGALASAPGVSIDAGEAGWFQTVHIRGGDIDQVGYELDGIPVNRAYDNAPQTMLSSLGQQELQVYTGGTPASADAQGISGFVNQVVKTGTHPGFGDATLGIGGPAFYHKASIETGGSTPDRRFSYYIGIGAADQDYRYVDNSNGADIPNSFFYPVNVVDPNVFAPGPNGGPVYVGANAPGTPLFANGSAFGIATTQQRDAIANLHFSIPHQHSDLRDDVQLMYLTSEVWAQYYSSQNDLGPALINTLGQNTWDDSSVYTGALMQPVNTSLIVPYYFPSSTTARSLGANLPAAQRDANDNGVAVEKLQYQHSFSPSAFVRVYGYSLYSNWFINGPNTAAQPYYGAELADYEIPDHTYGANVSFTDQLNDKNLITASASYTASNLQRYYVGYIHPTYNLTDFMNDGNCVSPNTGIVQPCYPNPAGGADYIGTNRNPEPSAPAPGVTGSWVATNNSFAAPLNQVHPRFSGLSLSDEWRPTDKITANIGLRVENFKYLFGDTGFNDPARQFWFAQFNQDYCVAGNTSQPFWNGLGPCPSIGAVATTHPNLQNVPATSYAIARWQPRLGFTYEIDANTVVRGSAGVYARPPNTSWVQYNVTQADLPSYLAAHFYSYGFNSPDHFLRPDTSYNYDLSLEKHFKGTDFTFKLTPFYRATRDQLQNFFIDPQGGLESGLNVGNQRSSGVEVALQKGDFSRNGLSGQLAYTYTKTQIKYQNFSGTNANVIDQLNTYIQQYNSYTYQCRNASPSTSNSAQCGTAGNSNAQASFNNGGLVVNNPYYCASTSSTCPYAAQPLLSDTASYTTYDVIPGPFAGSNGYAVPSVATLVLNYRHDRFAITPSLSFSSGASYGSPTVWPGYLPRACTGTLAGAAPGTADPAKCDSGGLPLFLPDPYNGNQFDSLGTYKEPWRLSASLGLSYEVSSRVSTQLTFTNLFDHCGQRGYAWDNPNVCVYGALPSGILAPAGNFYPNSNPSGAAPPPQLKYPYSFLLNNNNTGFVGVTIPMEVTFSMQIKL